MLTQTPDPNDLKLKAQQIKTHVPTALTQRGLLPKFSSWRLTQDPSTGLVVLFGILNDIYIAVHTQTPLGDYFDPRLLHDLATDLQVQVVPSNSEGLRYAFILDRGQLDQLTAIPDIADLQPDQLLAEETDSHKPLILTREEQGWVAVLAGSSKPTLAHREVYQTLAAGFQQMPMNPTPNFTDARLPLIRPTVIETEVQLPAPLFAPQMRYPKVINDYNLTTQGSGTETLPRLLLVLEEYNDLLRSLIGSPEEFALAAASFARVGRTWGITVLVPVPDWIAQ